jgi:hypothetical protein
VDELLNKANQEGVSLVSLPENIFHVLINSYLIDLAKIFWNFQNKKTSKKIKRASLELKMMMNEGMYVSSKHKR